MKVIFYSNASRETATTTNMLVTSVLADILYEKRSILLQARFFLEPSEWMLLSENLPHRQLEKNLAESLREKLWFAEDVYDVIYVDAGVVKESMAGMIFKEGDIMVVNLNQNPRVLDNFFHNYNQEEAKGNVLYILGNYDSKSAMDIKRLMKLYPALSEENTFLIPYNTEMRDAVIKAKLHSYFYKHIFCEKDDVNYEFVNEVKKITRFIMERATRA